MWFSALCAVASALVGGACVEAGTLFRVPYVYILAAAACVLAAAPDVCTQCLHAPVVAVTVLGLLTLEAVAVPRTAVCRPLHMYLRAPFVGAACVAHCVNTWVQLAVWSWATAARTDASLPMVALVTVVRVGSYAAAHTHMEALSAAASAWADAVPPSRFKTLGTRLNPATSTSIMKTVMTLSGMAVRGANAGVAGWFHSAATSTAAAPPATLKVASARLSVAPSTGIDAGDCPSDSSGDEAAPPPSTPRFASRVRASRGRGRRGRG